MEKEITPDRYAHAFGRSSALSLGVEEELLLIGEDRALSAEAESVAARVGGTAAERISTEIFAEQIEIKTGVCYGPDDVLSELGTLRSAIAEAGFFLLGAGLHPTSSGDPPLVSRPRYAVVRDDLGSILDTPPCGLHVHVGMPGPETAVRITNAFRAYLPALQAMSANSPFREGSDSGHASARTMAVRAYPRFEVPRTFRDYEDFCRVADQLIAAAGVEDYTYIWWDVRPHPRLGTVEVRAIDVQVDAETSAAFSALVQAIAARELDSPRDVHALTREALEESYFQAASHGLDAEILLGSAEPQPARAACRALLDDVRPYARELGTADAFEILERILRRGNGADDQRRIARRAGMPGVLEHLARRAV